MAKKKDGNTTTPVESHRHKDKRRNIPTEELRDFVKDEEQAPKEVQYPGLLYARDPSLDPQLVWKGKDEQDRKPLTVPAVPIYIQEKIHPQAIIEDIRAQAKKLKPEDQLNLFSDFNGIAFEDLIDFYHHEANWSNRMILCDSLLGMTSLAEKEGLKGQVQMIYIDPPYGIKFGSNWQVSTRKRDVKDGKAEDATRQPEQIRAFRDTWELGIHSYLAYWRDRLVAARELLTESGSVFVQIGDENVHLVRCVMDEVFGAENFCGMIGFQKTSSQSTVGVPSVLDYLLLYAKDKASQKLRPLLRLKQPGERGAKQYVCLVSPDMSEMRPMTEDELSGKSTLSPGWKVCRLGPTSSQGPQPGRSAPYVFRGKRYPCSAGRHWSYDPSPGADMDKLARLGRLRESGVGLASVLLADDNPTTTLDNVWIDTGTGSFTEDQVYVVQTGTKVIERCLLMTTDPGDLVLDPTCGSGTTAYVAEQWGRRWITCDTSRVALALARTRLMTARFSYYLLADSPEGQKKEQEITGRPTLDTRHSSDLRKGFVYKRVPHITLKSIANNEEIDAIHAKWQPRVDELRARINKAARQKWEEWEIPREEPAKHAKEREKGDDVSGPFASFAGNLSLLLAQWWQVRRDRQAETDASIAKRADTEFLYDQPYEDTKRLRVTGPFTVESLSPHRTISLKRKKGLADGKEIPGVSVKLVGAGDFGNVIIENLKKAGVQNTIKNERLKFDRLDVHPGVWIHAAGEFTEKAEEEKEPAKYAKHTKKDSISRPFASFAGSSSAGRVRRVAVCIGPEHGTVGPELVKEAAKEAVQGVGFDALIVAGFAFDPHVSEEAKRYGKLVVLPTRINADLQLGDEFLKKTGAGNLFMVFGEPDIEVMRVKVGADLRAAPARARRSRATEGADDERIVVEIRGLDIYDPTTGEIRNNSTDDIACWFIDTDYNGESFFVRHAYFTGADQPYDKLKRALRAEIAEAAWSALYSTRSRPFDPPKTGKIAVKVINHYGDEVLKVYDCC